MRRLVIVIDCDDGLINTAERLVASYNERYGTSVPLGHAHDSRYPEWSAERMEVLRRLAEFQNSDEYRMLLPRDDARLVVPRLARKHELYLVTARTSAFEAATTAMVNNYFHGCFRSIEHVDVERTKGKVCKLVNADVIVDDGYKHILSAVENGVALPIWFGFYPWQNNQDVSEVEGMRCADWHEAYKEIIRYANRL